MYIYIISLEYYVGYDIIWCLLYYILVALFYVLILRLILLQCLVHEKIVLKFCAEANDMNGNHGWDLYSYVSMPISSVYRFI